MRRVARPRRIRLACYPAAALDSEQGQLPRRQSTPGPRSQWQADATGPPEDTKWAGPALALDMVRWLMVTVLVAHMARFISGG